MRILQDGRFELLCCIDCGRRLPLDEHGQPLAEFCETCEALHELHGSSDEDEPAEQNGGDEWSELTGDLFYLARRYGEAQYFADGCSCGRTAVKELCQAARRVGRFADEHGVDLEQLTEDVSVAERELIQAALQYDTRPSPETYDELLGAAYGLCCPPLGPGA